MQHNFSGEQGIDSTTLSNHRTPSGQHGSGTAGFSTNSGTHGFSTNSTTGRIGIRAGISNSIDEFGSVYHMYLRSALRSTPIGYVQMSVLLGLTAAVRPKTPIVYTIYSVNQITGELEEKDSRLFSTKQYKPQGRHGSDEELSTNDYTPERRPRSKLGPFGHTPDGWALSDILATDLAPPTTTIAGSRLLGRRTATRTALRRRLGRRTGVWPTRQTYPYGYPYPSPPLVCNETRGLIRGQLVTP